VRSVGVDTAACCIQCRTSGLWRSCNCYTLSWRHSLCTAHCLHFSHGGASEIMFYTQRSISFLWWFLFYFL